MYLQSQNVFFSINRKWAKNIIVTVLFIGFDHAEYVQNVSDEVWLLVKRVTACLIALHDTKHLDILREETGRQQAMDTQL